MSMYREKRVDNDSHKEIHGEVRPAYDENNKEYGRGVRTAWLRLHVEFRHSLIYTYMYMCVCVCVCERERERERKRERDTKRERVRVSCMLNPVTA